ncbi:hypothetical protein ES703_71562 [subsurface metagenome]
MITLPDDTLREEYKMEPMLEVIARCQQSSDWARQHYDEGKELAATTLIFLLREYLLKELPLERYPSKFASPPSIRA